MNNEFETYNGSIWEIFYYEKSPIANPDYLVDEQTRNIVQDTFNPPLGLSPAEYSILFTNHFLKTREKSREFIDKNSKVSRFKILSQIGNRECLSELENIESSENFDSWENPSLVNYFKEITKQYL
jgi:hypothetical protein